MTAPTLTARVIAHPLSMISTSMPRFQNQVADAARMAGFFPLVYFPTQYFTLLPLPARLKKWMVYIDQYIIFGTSLFFQSLRWDRNEPVIFCDQALGILMHFVTHGRVIVHAHDLLALRSALGQYPENRLKTSGKLYQRLIRSGFRKASEFICVSEKTKVDLQLYGRLSAKSNITVVRNGLNFNYTEAENVEATESRGKLFDVLVPTRFALHVSGAQWYKNMPGLYLAYERLCELATDCPTLIVIGPASHDAQAKRLRVRFPTKYLRLENLAPQQLQYLYRTAQVYIQPSIDEGFGWPVIEAMACGCPVVATHVAPFTELLGDSGLFIPRRPDAGITEEWAREVANALCSYLSLTPDSRSEVIEYQRQQLRILSAVDQAKEFGRIYTNSVEPKF